MKAFSFKSEIKKIIDTHQLTAVRFVNAPDEFRVAYIINANPHFTTLAEITNKGKFDGISMYLTSEISSLSTNTPYIDQLAQKVEASVLIDVLKIVNPVKEFSFTGVAAVFKGSDTLIEVEYETDFRPIGKIGGYDDQALLLFEYHEKHRGPIAHLLIKFSAITRMSIGIPYMRNIDASL